MAHPSKPDPRAGSGIESQSSSEITVIRDRFGIPHIHAENAPGAVYALGWCQAEDRIEQIFLNYAKAAGMMASIQGEEWIAHDFQQRIHRHFAAAKEYIRDRIPPAVLAELKSFQNGIRSYCETHPEKVPDFSFPFGPEHAVAFARYMMFHWPSAQLYEVMGADTPSPQYLFSNEWALSPSKTADGRAVLCIDPHLPWDGEFRFYEAQIQAGGDRRHGFFPTGTCYMGLGHTSGVAWACTTGGPDTADVYRIRRHPENSHLYAYNGGWREMECETVSIGVRRDGNSARGKTETVHRKIYRSHHGPIIAANPRAAYAAKTAYDGRAEAIEQLYRMNHARTLQEFQDATSMCELMPQNIMAAGCEGDIWYCRTGRVPIRPDGYDWSRPVPGDTSETEWRGYHRQEDLVQVLNPPQGYMQNCNTSADCLMREGSPNPSLYPAYIYNGTGKFNSRGERALQLLSTAEAVDIPKALAILNDTYVVGCTNWQTELRRAARQLPARVQELDIGESAEAILQWDGHADIDSIGATLFREWQEQLRDACKSDDATPQTILEALAAARDRLREVHGSWRVPWGEVHRFERGTHSFPAAGGRWQGPMENFATLRTIENSAPPNERGQRIARYGQSHVTIAFLGASGIESYTVVPYGNSDDPASRHYADQASELFSYKKLKPSFFESSTPKSEIASRIRLKMETAAG